MRNLAHSDECGSDQDCSIALRPLESRRPESLVAVRSSSLAPATPHRIRAALSGRVALGCVRVLPPSRPACAIYLLVSSLSLSLYLVLPQIDAGEDIRWN